MYIKFINSFRMLSVGSIPDSIKCFLKKCSYWLAILLVLAALPFALQYLHLGDFHEAIIWAKKTNSPFAVNFSLIVILFIVLYPLFNSIFYALIAVVGFCGIYIIVDMQKMRILSQPLLPGDFLFLKQALLIARIYAGQAIIGCLVLVLLCLILFMIRKKVSHFEMTLPVRAAVFAFTVLLIIFTTICYREIIFSVNKRFHIINEYWNQLTNFKKNGVLYTFFMNLESSVIARPPDYSKKTVETIFTAVAYDSIPTASPPRPDVIVYLSESFWDITQIAPTSLPCDPMPTFRSLLKKNPSIRLVSPVFGGNTCNAEFEVLTGMSHGFFPPGVMAYNQLIQHPIPSLAKVFKDNGYTTTGIHTFKRWFWNRVNVYRQLGFDSFISVETMENPRIKGFYVADMELVNEVKRQASSSRQPDFIFALSMQNHGPYNVKRYDSLDCPVATGLSQTADREFNTYMQGLIDADASLGTLVTYIDTVRQPTLLLFFGDHLPGFADFYRETGVAERIKRDTLWSHTTMAVWYANYPLQQGTDSLISMMHLPPLIARQASIAVPRYYRYLDRLRSEFPVINEDRHSHNDTTIHGDSLYARRRNECRLCVYDALLGKRYTDRYHRLP